MSNEHGEQTRPAGEPDTTVTFAEPEGNIGSWERPDGVGTVYGAEGSVSVFGYDSTDSDGADVKADVAELSGEAYINDQEVRVGVEANLVEVEGTFGEFDATTAGDSSITFGGSVGAGLGFYASTTDIDGDGRPETGFGFDIGPISFGYRSEVEDPVDEEQTCEPDDGGYSDPMDGGYSDPEYGGTCEEQAYEYAADESAGWW
jgi:hypothetical protein